MPLVAGDPPNAIPEAMNLLSKGRAITGQIYSPVKSATVAGNDSETLEFRGRNADRYGVQRLIISTTDEDAITVKVARNEGDDTIFSAIHVKAITDLFQNSKLAAPLIIKRSRNLTVELTNGSGSPVDVSVMLVGLTAGQLEVVEKKLRDARGFVPRPRFIYGKSKTISDGEVFAPLQVVIPPGQWVFDRLALASSPDTANARNVLSARFQSGNQTVKQEATFQQILRQYDAGAADTAAYRVEDFDPFDVEVSNSDGGGTSFDVSCIAPCYPAEVLGRSADQSTLSRATSPQRA